MSKPSDRQIAEMNLQTLEETKDLMKKNQLQNQEFRKELEAYKNDFFKKLNNVDLKVDDRSVKETVERFERVLKNASKVVDLTRFAYGLIAVTILVLGVNVYLFWLNIQTKSDIREEYKQELTQKGQYNSEEDAEYLKKFRYWISKNPKDSRALNNSIEKDWKRKDEKKTIFGDGSKL